jgi:hypothetical protein
MKAALVKSGLALAGSLAAKANRTTIQTPDPTFSKATLRHCWSAAWSCGGSDPSACNWRASGQS